MSKSTTILFSIITIFFFIILSMYACIRYSLGCENNIRTSTEEEITRDILKEYDREALAQQQELLDFYERQKKLEEENKMLREKVEEQKAEIEKKEEQIKIKESSPIPVSSSSSQIPQQSTSKSLEEAAKQVGKETSRVVNQTNRVVKRIFKKF